MKNIIWSVVIVIGVVFGSIHPILINLGKDEDQRITFSSASVALCIESLKLMISGVLVVKDFFTQKTFSRPPFLLLYSVPAILYAVVNNLVTHAQAYMDPSSFQIMNNLKIVFTAVFYRLFISSQVSWRRWVAVTLLFVAGIVNSIGGLKNQEEQKENGEMSKVYITMHGIHIMLVYCCVSGLAGVYTELILKKYKQTSIAVQNSVLYGFGVATNGLLFVANNNNKTRTGTPAATPAIDLSTRGFFDGFSIYIWLIVITQALNGIIISLIMKHLSNLTRLLMIGISMILTTLLSSIIFSYTVDLYFIGAFILVMAALWLYYEDDTTTYVHAKTDKRV